MRILIAYLVALFSLVAQFSFGQQFLATVSKNPVNEGERFTLTFNLSERGANFTPPNLTGFKVVGGPNQSQSMEIINGSMSSKFSWSYQLVATKKGTFTISSASVKTSRGVVNSQPIQLQVRELSAAEKKKQSQQYLFLKTVVSRANVYQGEPLVATYKLYTRVNISEYDFAKNPELNGFWNKDFEIKENNRSTEAINGVQWTVFTLKKTLLYPQKSGKLLIDPMKMDFVVEKPLNRRRSFFSQVEQMRISSKSEEIRVNVKPLPIGAPKSFNGAVGQFSLKSKVSKTSLKANDGVDYSISLSGKGNLQLLGKPKLEFPQDFEVYDPKIDNKYSSKLSGTSGVKTFNYLVIPRFGGTFILKPFEFTFFDPKKKRYITLNSTTHELSVEKGLQDETISFRGGVNQADVKNLNSDIHYIKSTAVFSKNSAVWFDSLSYYLTLLIGPFLIFFAYLWKRKVLGDRADLVGTKRRKAKNRASKHLKEAAAVIEDDKLFYINLGKALNGYLSHKLNLPLSALTLGEVKLKLAASEVEASTVNQLVDTLERCEMSKYAPMTDVSKEQMLTDSTTIINQIETALK